MVLCFRHDFSVLCFVIVQRKLPGNPLLVVSPTGPSHTNPQYNKRTRFWNAQLSTLGKVIPVSVNTGGRVSVAQCLEQLVGAVRTKIQEVI